LATIEDVARAAGVSISTVSYALSGKRAITESTRQRVAAAARALNYVPNAGARMLAGSRTRVLGLTIPMQRGVHFPSYMMFVLEVSAAARAVDYDVLLLTRDEGEAGLRRVSSSSLVDGVILLDVAVDDDRVAALRDMQLPATWIGVPSWDPALHCVDLNFERSADLAVEHLVAAGHHKIALLGQPQAVYDRQANYAVRFKDAFDRAAERLEVRTTFQPADVDPESVRTSVLRMLDALPGITAIVLNTVAPIPQMAIQVLRAKGLSVPGDISVVAVGPVFTTDLVVPDYDHVAWPADLVCRRAVEIMLEQINGDRQPGIELLTPQYTARGSVA
jgi:DNA-binding LacI/PurR family transcriptional regulator